MSASATRSTASPATPAHEYAAYFGPAIFTPLATITVGHAAPRPGERAVDLACGTGILTRRLADAVGDGGAVVGVDVNPDMVAVARTTSASPTAAPISYVVGDAATTRPPEPPYDLVTCQQGLQFMPDRAAVTQASYRALRPGGRVMVACWRGLDVHPLFAALAEAELEHLTRLDPGVGPGDVGVPFSLGDPAQLARLLSGSGFADVRVHEAEITARLPGRDFVRRLEFAYAAVVPALAADPAAFEDLCRRIEQACAAVIDRHRTGDDVVVPMRSLVAVATR